MHAWGNRFHEKTGYPKGTGSTPDYLDWDLWVGPSPMHPFSEDYFIALNWRTGKMEKSYFDSDINKWPTGSNCLSWNMYRDFGNWQIGDMGSHTMDLAFNPLDADYPVSAQAEGEPYNPEVAPSRMSSSCINPANKWRDKIRVSWHQGGNMPKSPLSYVDLNKIGHGLHVLDEVFKEYSFSEKVVGLTKELGWKSPVLPQSMYIFKQPGIGGEVSCHQDGTFLYTDPLTVTGFWFAVEDATIDNGCLWAAPGGHKPPLRKVFRRVGSDDEGTVFEDLDETPLPDPAKDLVPLEVPAGTMVILNGKLPHWSDVNRSPVSRHAYTLHCISASATYPDWNWLQRPADMPLRRLDRSDRQ